MEKLIGTSKKSLKNKLKERDFQGYSHLSLKSQKTRIGPKQKSQDFLKYKKIVQFF